MCHVYRLPYSLKTNDMRLLFTALACLISVSVFGEVIRADINHDGESDKTTLISDSINPKLLTINVAGGIWIIGISLDFEKKIRSSKNRHNDNIDRYLFVKSNYTYFHSSWDSGGMLDVSGEDFNIIGSGIGRLRQKSANKFFDYSIGLGVFIEVWKTSQGDVKAQVFPLPIFSLGTRKITKNNNIIKYGVGFPELLHIGYGFSF